MTRRPVHVLATVVIVVTIAALYLFVFSRGQWP